jgi:putative copper export protein
MAGGALIFFELLAASVWVGGLVAIAIVARIVRAQFDPHDQVVFFRDLGRSYGKVGTAALGLALVCGAALLLQRPADAALVATVMTATLLVAVTAVAVRRARAMTRLRLRGLEDPALSTAIRRGARTAGLCRAAIAVLTLFLLALAAAHAA